MQTRKKLFQWMAINLQISDIQDNIEEMEQSLYYAGSKNLIPGREMPSCTVKEAPAWLGHWHGFRLFSGGYREMWGGIFLRCKALCPELPHRSTAFGQPSYRSQP